MPVSPDFLQAFPIFAGVLGLQLDDVAAHAEARRYRGRRLIVQEGQPCEGLHLVAEGRVKVFRRSGTREQIMTVLGPGDVVDAAPLIDGGAHRLSAQALGRATVCFVDRATMLKTLDECPSVREALLGHMAERLRTFANLAGDLAFKDATSRLAGAILACADEGSRIDASGTQLDRKLTRRELAARASTVREVALRTLKRLQQQGLIADDAGRIVILDRGGLQRVAQGDARE
ncbi:MAG TPA: Crp/Fnr family transcriptional regulator [Anaerolineae bacterium]|nr:Crp/Fnr family transcriptional regulator [Anaerolineae bacterium]